MSKLILSFMAGALITVLAVVVFFAILNQTPRRAVAVPLVNVYKFLSHQTPPIVETPFTDLTELSTTEQNAVSQLYGLHITAGTSASTWSPDVTVTPPQALTFAAKLWVAVWGW